MPRSVFYILLILVTSAAAQDCTQTVPVVLADRETGVRIGPLTTEMVKASMGEAPLPISGTTRITAGRILVLIDESGSMSETRDPYKGRALTTVKLTLNDLVAALPPGISIEFGLFNKQWAFSDGFASDPTELRKNLAETIVRFGKRGEGRTALRDALHHALLRFGTPQPGDSLLLLTDGGDNTSMLATRDLEHDFRVAHVRLLIIMVDESSPAPEELMDHDWVEELAKNTGGTYLTVDATNQSWGDKKDHLRNVAMIRRFWNDRVLGTDGIQVLVPSSLTKETKWKLSVNRDADPRLKHAAIIYPDRLSPCPVATPAAH
ncbi:MAG TPA: vWA domain-containing protein [Candidatus Angelobacter sp.]|nr:vWA domain-containing protein [Candidatus Angelobacter sp.]